VQNSVCFAKLASLQPKTRGQVHCDYTSNWEDREDACLHTRIEYCVQRKYINYQIRKFAKFYSQHCHAKMPATR